MKRVAQENRTIGDLVIVRLGKLMHTSTMFSLPRMGAVALVPGVRSPPKAATMRMVLLGRVSLAMTRGVKFLSWSLRRLPWKKT